VTSLLSTCSLSLSLSLSLCVFMVASSRASKSESEREREKGTVHGYRHDAINRLCNNYNLSNVAVVPQQCRTAFRLLKYCDKRARWDPPGRQRATARSLARSLAGLCASEPKRAENRQGKSRSRDTKTIICRDFSLLPFSPASSPPRRATALYVSRGPERDVRATLCQRCGFRVTAYGPRDSRED